MPPRLDTHSSPAFAEAWRLWLGYRSHGARPLRASTLADYESIYRRYLGPALGEVPIERIDALALAQLTVALSTAGVRPKRVSNILVPLRACLAWHHRIGALERDPAPLFGAPAPAADERIILTPAEIERLLDALPAFYRPYVAFAAYVGTRAGEQRALTWDDVDLKARNARIDKTYFRTKLQHLTKTGDSRIVPLPPHIAEMLAEWRDQCPPSPPSLVFPSPTGKTFDLDTFRSRVFKPAVRAAGLPPALRIHDLRHTCASLHLQSGATLREVMEIHGWRQMQTALRYLHTMEPLNAAADRLSAAREESLDASRR